MSTRRRVALLTTSVTCALLTAAAPALAAGAPRSAGAPVISGQPVVGQTLTTTSGSWRNAPTSFTYAWQRCNASGTHCHLIPGATTPKYVIVDADEGSTLRSRVTASNAYGSTTRRSAPTVAVTQPAGSVAPPANTGKPVISGTAQTGGTLTASDGTWSGGTPMTYAYQWQLCDSSGASCGPISGATAKSYTLDSAAQGHTLRAQVTAANGAGTASQTSDPSGVVQPAPAPPPPATGALHVSGDRLIGSGGSSLQLHGVNRSGTEYACIQGWGI
ncbi:MAG: hypothetical protein ACXVHK_29395, partial [Solirubrobacteraceae bacterium]